MFAALSFPTIMCGRPLCAYTVKSPFNLAAKGTLHRTNQNTMHMHLDHMDVLDTS